MSRFAPICLLTFLSFASVTALAQEEAAEPTPSKRVLKAYDISKTAKSEAEFQQMIELLRGVEEQDLDESLQRYRRDLLSWALNRHGEKLADRAAEEEQQDPAAALQQQALQEFEEAVELNPTSHTALHNRGVSYAMLGKFELAEADFSATIEQNKDFAKAWFNRGEIRYAQGKFEEAIGDYTQAIKLKPSDVGAYTSRGHCYFQTQQYDKALTDYRQVVQLRPSSGQAIANRGDAYLYLGRYREAVNDYLKAIALEEDFGSAHQRLAWLYAVCPDDRYRKPADAVQQAKLAIKLNGDQDPRYLDTLAAAQASEGDYASAVATAEKAIERAEGQPALLEKLNARLGLYRQEKAYDLNTQLP